jgi:LysM repeat protein
MLVVCCLGWFGCDPRRDAGLGEEREPLYLTGRRRSEQADYLGAAEAFEQALQNNPRSAAAHFELGLIYYDKLNDPAAAIYHFQRFLKLRPAANKADPARQLISVCKQELVKEVPFNSVNQQMQKELERLTRDNNDLRQQLDQLRLQLAQRTPISSNSPPGLAPAPTSGQPMPTTPLPPTRGPDTAGRSAGTPETSRSPATSATHVVRSGETPYSIARRYGLQTSALLAANPSLDPKRLKVGQVLNLPPR